MRRKTETMKPPAEKIVKDIRRRTRKQHSAEEKIPIVLEGLRGEESIAELCRREGIATSLYCSWSKEFMEAGKRRLSGDTARQASAPEVKELRAEASALKEAVADLTLEDRRPHPGRDWNRIPDEVRKAIVELALEESDLSPRELAVQFTDTKRHFVSEASVYRILKAQDLIASPAYVVIKAADEFHDKTVRPNQLWQTDFTYLKVVGWGWYYLSTILDDFSRYVVAWKLCTTMRAEDVTDTLDLALAASGCDRPTVLHRPRLLSDNGSSYIAGDLAEYLHDKGMDHVRGAPNHPQTQGKIERWHQTLKNRILLENHYLPGALEAAVAEFVDHCNHRRVHESLGNVTPADVYFGRAEAILAERRRIKDETIRQRRLLHHSRAA